MACRVYKLGMHQNAKQYEAEVVLLDRVVRAAVGRRSIAQNALGTAMALYRRARKLPDPGYREPHAAKQYLVNQLNSAILNSQEYRNFEQLVAERKAEAARSRNSKAVVIPQGFRPIELRQFHEMSTVAVRRATFRERAQFLVLGLLNIPDALTPSAKPVNDSEKE